MSDMENGEKILVVMLAVCLTALLALWGLWFVVLVIALGAWGSIAVAAFVTCSVIAYRFLRGWP